MVLNISTTAKNRKIDFRAKDGPAFSADQAMTAMETNDPSYNLIINKVYPSIWSLPCKCAIKEG